MNEKIFKINMFKYNIKIIEYSIVKETKAYFTVIPSKNFVFQQSIKKSLIMSNNDNFDYFKKYNSIWVMPENYDYVIKKLKSLYEEAKNEINETIKFLSLPKN